MSERDDELRRQIEEARERTGMPFYESEPTQDVSNTAGREDASISGQSPSGVGEGSHAYSEECVCESCVAQRQGKQREHDFITESSDQVADTLGRVSGCLRDTAKEMSEHDHPVFGQYVKSAAEGMERFSNSLRHKDMDFFVHQTEELARHQPGIFLGSAFTMGFALGRFLKGKSAGGMSSESRRQYTKRQDMAAVTSEGIGEPEIWH